MKKILLLHILLAFILIGCSSEAIETNMSEKVDDFQFTTQDNESLGLKDLEGQWWIADFIFTNCTTVCLPMTANMAELQSRMKDENLDVQLVSFSVDPDYDTPEVLKEYGERYQADFGNWSFLTGYDFQTIKELSIKSFKNLVKEPLEGDNQVMHGTRFYLVNPEGEVIKGYDGISSSEIDIIVGDLRAVTKE
ncbi:SCO family protein [Oceanobacillus profundus]|uniref:SCO family protein n=1 Tax=Oceanobacillus profundus TaxID=372463 RepID=A0A417YLD1_9BACI|nr:SCO family protein [Oceanobacillus profundus]MBR3117768.1 SCO family protein [Oceanobacillus sp.]PAE29381.1 cytochrome c oxidase assembly protein [Paenibacillus sp. 7884-2]RHW34260.1 SCO family protein [Oceanobacillus profundus]